MEIVLIVSGLVVVLFVLFSPDPLSSAIRARIPWLQSKAASAVDSVDSRVTAARVAQGGNVRRGRQSLYAIQTLLAESELGLKGAAREIEEDNTALAMARRRGDREVFDALVSELNRDTAYHAQLVAAHAQLVEQLKNLEVTVDEQRAKEQAIEVQGRVMVAQARVADVTTMVNEAAAGLTDSGADAHMAEAEKILRRTTARANAAQSAVAGLTPNERSEKKAAAYLQQARQGVNGLSADDLWNQMSDGSAGASVS